VIKIKMFMVCSVLLLSCVSTTHGQQENDTTPVSTNQAFYDQKKRVGSSEEKSQSDQEKEVEKNL
jgi:hypothetical protein